MSYLYKPFVNNEDFIRKDNKINKIGFNIVYNSAIGYLIGIGISIPFKRKSGIKMFTTGLYSGFYLNKDLNEWFIIK